MRPEIATQGSGARAPLSLGSNVIHQAIEKLGCREDLTRAEASGVMQELLSGTVSDDGIIRFLVALRDKGEKAAELTGFAEVMRERAAEHLRRAGVDPDELAQGSPLLDTCGTGGDGQGTFNVSTATAIVAAAAGVRVAKHGNRSISSRSGSADVLEALGVAIDLPLDRIRQCLDRVGMVFLFAPHLHLAMKHVMNARRALKTKTVFNLLGPLTNPLAASVQLLGVYDRARTEMMAETLAAFGTRRALVVAAWDGIDEISTTGPTQLSETAGVRPGRPTVATRHIGPEDFGLSPAPAEALRGGDPPANAALIRRVLAGERGPVREVVLANTSAALVAAGTAQDFVEGVRIAASAIDSRVAERTLAALVEFTQKSRR